MSMNGKLNNSGWEWHASKLPTLIADRVAVGPELPYTFLRHFAIDAVIDLRETFPIVDPQELGAIKLFRAPIDDGVSPDIKTLATICRTIDIYGSSFFYIHCFEGVGRAVTVGTAYLMWREGWDADTALQRMVTLRPAANPTKAQIEALHAFEDRVIVDPQGKELLRVRPLAPLRPDALIQRLRPVEATRPTDNGQHTERDEAAV